MAVGINVEKTMHIPITYDKKVLSMHQSVLKLLNELRKKHCMWRALLYSMSLLNLIYQQL